MSPLPEKAVTAADADVRLQRAVGVPDLDLLGGYKRNSGLQTRPIPACRSPCPFAIATRAKWRGLRRRHAWRKIVCSNWNSPSARMFAAAQEAYTHQQAVVHDILPDMRARAKQNLAIMDDAYRTGGVDLLRYLDAERNRVRCRGDGLAHARRVSNRPACGCSLPTGCNHEPSESLLSPL